MQILWQKDKPSAALSLLKGEILFCQYNGVIWPFILNFRLPAAFSVALLLCAIGAD